jgi:spermidine synthase
LGVISFSEQDGVRYLHFGSRWIQGAVRIGRPDALVLAYVRDMMAWLMLLDPPREILQLGLGAASLTRFCHRRMPESRVTVVEIDPDVVDVARQWFGLPEPDDRLQVHIGDAGRFVARPDLAGRFGVVQVDLYDAAAAGPVRDSARFYADCHRLLAEPGILVVNLFGRDAAFERSGRRVERCFGQTAIVDPLEAGNLILFGFKGPPITVGRAWLEERGRLVHARYGLATSRWTRTFAAAFGPGRP